LAAWAFPGRGLGAFWAFRFPAGAGVFGNFFVKLFFGLVFTLVKGYIFFVRSLNFNR
jgi:hypothetical protein